MDGILKRVMGGHEFCDTLARGIPWRGLPAAAVALVIILCLVVQPSAAQMENRSQVLILQSYHRGMSWTDQEQEGIEAALENASEPIEVLTEYMDAKRIDDDRYFSELADLYAYKYHSIAFDAVIACDDPAFSFVRRYRGNLFAGVPVIFCGINYFSDEMIANDSLTTGVVEAMDFAGTLDSASALHPGLSTVIVINDRTETGVANKLQMLDAIGSRNDGLQYIFLEDLTMNEVREYVSRPAEDTIVLLLTFNRDGSGTGYSYEDAAGLIIPACAVPVYVVWDIYLDYGVVGGSIISGHEQGRIAGELAVRTIAGEPVSEIPVVRNPGHTPMFDYTRLSQYGLDTSRLPEGSVIRNVPASSVEIPREVLYIAVFGFTGLALIACILYVHAGRERLIAEKLRESEEKFRALLNAMTDVVMLIDREGILLATNETTAQHYGRTADDMIGMNIYGFFPPDTRASRKARVDGVFSSGRPLRYIDESRGRIIDIIVYPIPDACGETGRAAVIARDITEREQLEAMRRQAFAQIEHNIEQFAYLGDHVRNPLQVILGLATLERSWTGEQITRQVEAINAIIADLDRGWMESENVRQFLRRHYGLNSEDDQAPPARPEDGGASGDGREN